MASSPLQSPTAQWSDNEMTINPSPTVTRLLNQQLSRGRFASENEVLEEALRTLAEKQELEDTLRAVREGVAAAEAGETSSVEEVFARLEADFPSLKNDR
jgi:putative addiction module CopG family antidote